MTGINENKISAICCLPLSSSEFDVTDGGHIDLPGWSIASVLRCSYMVPYGGLHLVHYLGCDFTW